MSEGAESGGNSDISGGVVEDARVPGDVCGDVRKGNMMGDTFRPRNSGKFSKKRRV
jgi:hypothetical protein